MKYCFALCDDKKDQTAISQEKVREFDSDVSIIYKTCYVDFALNALEIRVPAPCPYASVPEEKILKEDKARHIIQGGAVNISNSTSKGNRIFGRTCSG